ncbi:protein kinase [Streptomyces sp. NPDC007905]|uniref:serine/threonine-protein kinase n=1 Tax=Streptomyces sp. NPDC007905 TaxID=3364788 RepID=UPI0036EA8D25
MAVKLLHTEQAADAERFRLEAQTAGRLNHPNVVGMYDLGSHHDRLYLVMELVDGWSLAQARSLRGVLNPQDAAAIAAQAAAGLAAAHQRGVIHRDVKPANVMLSGDRKAKIADFGIARFTDEAASALTVTGKILGTADYLAPERALGRPAQPASYVYSLGCVLYELLTGRPPFRGATSLAVVQQHVEAAPAPPSRLRPGIPQQLCDYVLLLLAKDPAHRPTAEQAANWLARYHQTPPSPSRATPRSCPHRSPIPLPACGPIDPGARCDALPSARRPQTTHPSHFLWNRPGRLCCRSSTRSVDEFRRRLPLVTLPSGPGDRHFRLRNPDAVPGPALYPSDRDGAARAGTRWRQGPRGPAQARAGKGRERALPGLNRAAALTMMAGAQVAGHLLRTGHISASVALVAAVSLVAPVVI